MNITIECKPDSYVGCTPPSTLPPSDCANGWEIGNGTIVCATEVPAPLAATGLDGGMTWAFVAIALAACAVGTSLIALSASVKATKLRRRAAELKRDE